MSKNFAYLGVLLLMVCVLVTGCAQTNSTETTTTTTVATTTSTTTTSTTTTTFAYPTATLTHWGFDFATGTATDEPGKYDGETINWNPDNVTTTVEGTTYPSYDIYLWWRAAYPLDTIAHQQHLGQVALNTVTTVPASWESGSLIWPLLVNHVYVVMCTPEGYAKFKVTSTATSASWPVEVEYYFTSEATFDR